jgi:hypothetical protein
VLLLPSPSDLSFDFPFLVFTLTPDVPEVVVPPTEVPEPRDVEDKSKLVKEFKVITLFTKPITVLVEVVVVVVVILVVVEVALFVIHIDKQLERLLLIVNLLVSLKFLLNIMNTK